MIMGTCSSWADCHHMGVCIDGKCECDLYIDGPHCETPYMHEIGHTKFAVWRFVFLSISILLNLAISYHLYVFFRIKRQKKKRLGLRGVTHIFLWVSSMASVLYFATDPMGQTRSIPFVLEQILFGLQIFCIFLAYLTLILFWVGAYHSSKKGVAYKSSWVLQNTRPIFAVAVAIWFVLEFSERIIFGLHLPYKGRYILDTLYNAYIGVVCFIFSGTMTVYGTLMIRRFMRSPAGITDHNPLIRKVTIVSVVVSCTLMLSVIVDLAVVIQKILYNPRTVLPSFSVVHAMFFILLAEMAYFTRPARDKKRTASMELTPSSNPIVPSDSDGTPPTL